MNDELYRKANELERRVAHLRRRLETMRETVLRGTLPISGRLWIFQLNEAFGNTTVYKAAADLIELQGTDTLLDVTLTDVLQCISSSETGQSGLCVEQYDIDGTLMYVPLCCEASCFCDYCDENTTPCQLEVVLSGNADNGCDECEALDGTYILDKTDEQGTGAGRCRWQYYGEHECGTGYDSTGELYIQASIQREDFGSHRYYWEVWIRLHYGLSCVDPEQFLACQNDVYYRWFGPDANTWDCSTQRTLDKQAAISPELDCDWPSTITLQGV